MRILVIEDDKQISNSLKRGLQDACFVVDTAQNGTEGSFQARTNEYDLIILDLMLPGKDGKDVCREIRRAEKNMPILMLSVVSEIPTKVELLEMGADDYMTKPFLFEELLARVRALLRRPRKTEDPALKFADLEMDVKKHSVKRAGQEIYLTKKEFMLLEYFLKNQGEVLSRAMILEHVWDMNADPFSNTIEAHIRSLRRKIDKEEWPKIIHTISGRGYKLDNHR